MDADDNDDASMGGTSSAGASAASGHDEDDAGSGSGSDSDDSSSSSSGGDSSAEMRAAAGAGGASSVPPSRGSNGSDDDESEADDNDDEEEEDGASDDDEDDDDEEEDEGGSEARRGDLSPVPTSVASTMTPDALDQSFVGAASASAGAGAGAGAGGVVVGGKQLRMADDDEDGSDNDDEDGSDDDEEDEEDGSDEEGDNKDVPVNAVAIPAASGASQGKVLRRDVQEAAQTLGQDEDVVTATAVATAEAMDVDATATPVVATSTSKSKDDEGNESDSSEDIPIAQVHKKIKATPKKKATDTNNDDEVVVAAVIDDDADGANDDGEEVIAAAVVVEDSAAPAATKAKKRKKPGPKAKAGTTPTPVKKNKDGSIRKKPGPKPGTKPGSAKKKPGAKPAKKGGGTSKAGTSGGARKRKHPERFEEGGEYAWEEWPAEAFLGAGEVGDGVSAYDVKMSQYAASVPTAKMDAAISSRSFLSSNVEILPFPVSENIVVRAFGRVKVERNAIMGEEAAAAAGKSKKSKPEPKPKGVKKGSGRKLVEPLYSSAASIHPVGFSCDRFEYSPIHGRMIRLRCDILDGAKVRQLRLAQKDAAVKAKRAAKAKKTREENKRKKEEAEAEAAAAAAAAAASADVQADAAPSSAAGPAQGNGSETATDPAAVSAVSTSAPATTANGAAGIKSEPSSTKVKEEQASSGDGTSKDDDEVALDDLPSLNLEDDDDYEGPIFRVMWGAGIEQNPENDYSYPYDVYSASAPLTDDHVDAVAVPLDGSGHVLGRSMVPEVGMRVSVRFDETRWYGGTITEIKDSSKKGGKKLSPGQRLLSIDYDDGNQEEAAYPDPDILLRPPGTEIEGLETGDVDVMEIKGKPVVSAIGKTAVEAWGKALISLGLIDEMMYTAALDALEVAREEGRIEAEERIALQTKQRQEARAREREKKLKKKEEEEAAAAKAVAADTTPVYGSNGAATATTSTSSDGKGPGTPVAAAAAEAPVAASVPESTTPSPSKDGDDVKMGDVSSPADAGGEPETKEAAAKVDPNRETESEQENELRDKIRALRGKLDAAQTEAQVASANLTEARIAALGPFFSNPFDDVEETLSNQHTWLSTIVRKEKAKMGNTGSKRKVVAAADLLERTDSFFNPDVERLIEGLPGSEFCPSYVFHSQRKGGTASAGGSSWVHEAQIKHEQERKKKAKAAKKAKEKSKVETNKMKEKELKRKKKEEEAEERKKKKLAQEEQVKQAREDERLARLKVQVDERLSKEARRERKKVIEAMAKNMSKEFTRRRRAAEIVASDRVENSKEPQTLSDAPMFDTYLSHLPPLARRYDVDVVRVWDFISSFEKTLKSFGDDDEDVSLPSLDALQDAVNTLACDSSGSTNVASSSTQKNGDDQSEEDEIKEKHREAVGLLSKLAVSLCKPLSADLFKLISSVVVTETDAESTEETTASTDDDDINALPVTDMTWREVARLSLLSDALGELGCNKHEVVALLRGWRNAGHPNSKEAKRMRRIEEFGLASLNQQLLDMAENRFVDGSSGRKAGVTVKVTAPCKPSAGPSDWTFYLHNVKALEPNAATAIKSNLRRAIAILKEDKDESKKAKNEEIINDLTAGMSVFESIGKEAADSTEIIKACTEARTKILKLLDEATGEPFSTKIKSEIVYRDTSLMAAEKSATKPSVRKVDRQSMGLVDDLMMTEGQYKSLDHQREAYIEQSEKLKEEVERRLKREAGEEVDEDDDDDDDDDMSVDGDGKSSKKSTPTKEDGDDCDKKKAAESTDQADIEGKIGKSTPYDFFCADDPSFPELIRRCLAVLRALCASPAGETFVYPVDAQSNPRYYEIILKPVSLHDIGKTLRDAGKRLATKTSNGQDQETKQGNSDIASWSAGDDAEKEVESVVAEFGRSIRRISLNTSCYSNVGASIISSADEMLRLFERLFFDWVLAPAELLPPLELLDDDKCIDPHETDGTAVVLICDGCEGKFNMERIVPAMKEVPKGDWYCQRCVSGRSWGQLDPRIGRKIRRRLPPSTSIGTNDGTSPSDDTSTKLFKGTISRCIYSRPNKSDASRLAYVVSYADGDEEVLTLKEVDEELKAAGNPAPPIRCLEAVAESPGYGVKRGPDQGLVLEFVPPFVNPNLSDPAAQASISNSVFRDTVRSCSTLSVVDAEDMTAPEWLRLLVLLVTKCSTNDSLQEVASEMESKANDFMSELITETSKITSFYDLLPKVTDDEYDGENDGDEEEEASPGDGPKADSTAAAAAAAPTAADAVPVANGDVKMGEAAVANTAKPDETAAAMDVDEVEAELVEAIPVVEAMPSNDTEALTDITKSSLSGITSGRNTPSASGRNTPASTIGPDEVISAEELRRRQIAKAKAKRQKEVEDCYVASAIKHMVKPTVASFEEDGFSHLVDSALSPKNMSISLDSLRCQGMVCDFCKLPDSSLGLPLIRAPNQKEWLESMQYCASNRNCRLIAGLPSVHTGLTIDPPAPAAAVSATGADNDGDQKMADAENGSAPSAKVGTADADSKVSKLVSVTIRVNGELISEPVDVDEEEQQQVERGMLEFLPRNAKGMQDVLKSRAEDDVLFVSGSLSAHECCAVAAHKARKDALVKHHRDLASAFAENDAAATCGRTAPLGYDKIGRAYFRFQSDPSSLFIADSQGPQGSEKRWHRFVEKEDIACIISCLGEEAPAEELRARYPEAAKLVRNHQWADIIQRRTFDIKKLSSAEDDDNEKKSADSAAAAVDAAKTAPMDIDGNGPTADSADNSKSEEKEEDLNANLLDPTEKPYVPGEDVLVESATGKLLWDASVIAVSKDRTTDQVNGYRVHYKEWSSRFDEWVDILRVVEPSEYNIEVQTELLDEYFDARGDGVPTSLEGMGAATYLNSANRERGSAPVPNFAEAISVGPGASIEDENIGKLKAGLLLIEAALPRGSVDPSVWTPEKANSWRSMVCNATGPGSLMGSLLVLETSILAEAFYPQGYYLLQCLQTPWRAQNSASTVSVALRLSTLDRAIKFDAGISAGRGGRKRRR